MFLKRGRFRAYLAKAPHHFLYQRAHRCNIDDFEIIHINCSINVDVFSNFSQHSHQSNICFTSSLLIQKKMLICYRMYSFMKF